MHISPDQWDAWAKVARDAALDEAGDQFVTGSVVVRAVELALAKIKAQLSVVESGESLSLVRSTLQQAARSQAWVTNASTKEMAVDVIRELHELRTRVTAAKAQDEINANLQGQLHEIRAAAMEVDPQILWLDHDSTLTMLQVAKETVEALRGSKEDHRVTDRKVREILQAALPARVPGVSAEKLAGRLAEFAGGLETNLKTVKDERNILAEQAKEIRAVVAEHLPLHKGIPLSTVVRRVMEDQTRRPDQLNRELRLVREQQGEMDTRHTEVRDQLKAAMPDMPQSSSLRTLVAELVARNKAGAQREKYSHHPASCDQVEITEQELRLMLSRFGMKMSDGSTLFGLVSALRPKITKLVQQRDEAEGLREAIINARKALDWVSVHPD